VFDRIDGISDKEGRRHNKQVADDDSANAPHEGAFVRCQVWTKTEERFHNWLLAICYWLLVLA
jgi:hypothetical protein